MSYAKGRGVNEISLFPTRTQVPSAVADYYSALIELIELIAKQGSNPSRSTTYQLKILLKEILNSRHWDRGVGFFHGSCDVRLKA